MTRPAMRKNHWGSSDATSAEPHHSIYGRFRAFAVRRVERILVHPRRPDAAGCPADLDRPDAALHACRLGPGALRLLRPGQLAQRRAREGDAGTGIVLF